MSSIATCSVWDLNCTLKNGISNLSPQDFRDAILKEKDGQNRVTIIKLLERGLKAKNNGKSSI